MASLSAEEEELHLALALSASEAAPSPPPPATPPPTLSGTQLRQRSETQKWGGPRRVGPNTRSDQNKCHRIENSTLVKAYNSTADEDIKREIMRFNMSKDNAFHGANNKDHTAMENAFRSRNPNKAPTATQYDRKADMLLTAISNLCHYKDDYSTKTCVHILKTLKDESPRYNEIVAGLKKSSFSDPAIKAVIDEARQCEQEHGHADADVPRTPTRATLARRGQTTEDPKVKAKAKAAAAAAQEEEDRSYAVALDLQGNERRSVAAKKGWETRRRNEAAAEDRTAAADRAAAARDQEAADRRLAVSLDQQETERRSVAAKKGWETRRRNEAAAEDRAVASRAAEAEAEAATRRRSEAAMRGWETRRQNQALNGLHSVTGMGYGMGQPMGFTGSPLYSFSGFQGGPTKADGTPDMRYKVNRG